MRFEAVHELCLGISPILEPSEDSSMRRSGQKKGTGCFSGSHEGRRGQVGFLVRRKKGTGCFSGSPEEGDDEEGDDEEGDDEEGDRLVF